MPCCCVLPEDKVSGLAMQGKPVALSRGATVWEVDDEVEPITCFNIKPLGVTSTLCLYCYAMLVDVVWVSVSMTDVSVVT